MSQYIEELKVQIAQKNYEMEELCHGKNPDREKLDRIKGELESVLYKLYKVKQPWFENGEGI
jgi:hypothetical protein